MKSATKHARASVSPARAAAFDILLRVERDSSFASELLHSDAYHRLSPEDHALATDLVMGVLRWRLLLDSEIAGSSSQPLARLDLEVLTALRLGVYQLRQLDRIPARAATHQSVELVKRARKRSAASFTNAALRKIARDSPKFSFSGAGIGGTTAVELAAIAAHPLWLVERWIDSYGLEAATKICEHNQRVPIQSFRLRNPNAEEELRRDGIELDAGALVASARRAAPGSVAHGTVTAAGAFKGGLIAIQDEASQLVAYLVGRGEKILDCCAAPGGKTSAIADRNLTSEITAVELHPHRARLLRQLLRNPHPKKNDGVREVLVVAADARHLPFTIPFDRVLADVPCSGTGTLGRNPEIKWRLTLEDIADLQARQLAILQSAMKHVSTGGRLVYSTCSLEKEENEEVIEQALRGESVFRLIDCGQELEGLQHSGEVVWPEPASLTHGPFLRTIPGVHPCDGFFAAIIERVK